MAKQTTQIVTVGATTATVLVRGGGFDALTGSGRGYADNAHGYDTQDKRFHTPAWEDFRRALGSRDAKAIVDTAKRLRSVRVRLDTSRPSNPNYGLRVSHRSNCLFCAPVV